ncbi:SRPBCC family protein [Mycolicibacterium litorale]|uniref:SRPBCC family protein n=1 Tax=Mycolicibacterium litorale TaxID=758802 RepID=UPI003CF34DD6
MSHPASRHISVWIAAAPDAVYDLASDPQTWPRWAAGLAQGGLRRNDRGWVADSPMGEVVVEFSPANAFGVLDHVVRMPSGEAVYNPLRVVPAGPGEPRCEVVFSLRRRAGMTDAEFEQDAAAVAADLEALRALVEG